MNRHIDLVSALPLYNKMVDDELSYVYYGIFTNEVANSLISLAENLLKISRGTRKTKRKVFYILVECVQNIARHQEKSEKQSYDSPGIFVVQNHGECYNVVLGNMIFKKQIPDLRGKLNRVNELNKTQLKEYYKVLLKDNVISEKGGAGLGLIEMARKSGNKIDFHFEDADAETSIFYMSTKIDEETLSAKDLSCFDRGIKTTQELYDIMEENNLNLLFRSGFTKESAVDISDMLNSFERDKNYNIMVRKKIFRIMIELTQNISQHAASLPTDIDGRQGLLIFGKDGNNDKIITGNFMPRDETEDLDRHIKFINRLNNKQLTVLYSKTLIEADLEDVKKTGLGLIDTRIKSGNKLEHKIEVVNDAHSYLSVKAVVKP
jgi:hypothetical protein